MTSVFERLGELRRVRVCVCVCVCMWYPRVRLGRLIDLCFLFLFLSHPLKALDGSGTDGFPCSGDEASDHHGRDAGQAEQRGHFRRGGLRGRERGNPKGGPTPSPFRTSRERGVCVCVREREREREREIDRDRDRGRECTQSLRAAVCLPAADATLEHQQRCFCWCHLV